MSGDADRSQQGSGKGLRLGLIVIVVAGLAIDAYVHLHLAAPFDGVKSSVLTQGDLFRAEAALAIIAALALIVRPRRWTAVIAFLVSAGGFALVLLYQFVNVGAIGPLPNMYDPVSSPEKTLSIIGEGVAALAALILIAALQRRAVRNGSAAGTVTPASSAG